MSRARSGVLRISITLVPWTKKNEGEDKTNVYQFFSKIIIYIPEKKKYIYIYISNFGNYPVYYCHLGVFVTQTRAANCK